MIYLNKASESWVVDRFRDEWYEYNKNISTKNIQKYKNLNINYISVRDLTKNIKAVDFSLLLKN